MVQVSTSQTRSTIAFEKSSLRAPSSRRWRVEARRRGRHLATPMAPAQPRCFISPQLQGAGFQKLTLTRAAICSWRTPTTISSARFRPPLASSRQLPADILRQVVRTALAHLPPSTHRTASPSIRVASFTSPTPRTTSCAPSPWSTRRRRRRRRKRPAERRRCRPVRQAAARPHPSPRRARFRRRAPPRRRRRLR